MDTVKTGEFFAACRADVVIHLAANCGGIGYNASGAASLMQANTLMAMNVFEAARTSGITRINNAGSCDSYPARAPLPWREDSLWDGPPEPTSAAYAMAKRYIISLGNAYNQQYGIQVVHLIFSNLFGIDDHFNAQRSHVIPALIYKIDEAQRRDKHVLEIWGTGSPQRELLYASDAARIVVRAVNELTTSCCLNVGSGMVFTVQEIAEHVAGVMGFCGDLIFDKSRPDGHSRKMLDTSSLRKWLGPTFNFTPFSEALARTVEEFWSRAAATS